MDCQQIRLMLAAFQDGRVLDSERQEVKAHLRMCTDCAHRFEQLQSVRGLVRGLQTRPVPRHLELSLQVIASKEAQRRRRYAGLKGLARRVAEQAQLFALNLMRPLAVPAAGGLFSAVVLFSAMLTNYHGIVRQPVDDVPTMLATNASMKTALFSVEEFAPEVLTVDVLVDGQGRAIDFNIQSPATRNHAELRRRIAYSLLFTQFEPATAFGQPTPSWVRVAYRRIDVKG